jgi:hypothetical protein
MRKDSSGQWVAVWGGSEPFDAFTYPDGLRVWPTSEHFYGTAASGIAMVPGLILLDDLKQNYIDHPVMFSVPNACQHYKPPATREDGMGGADCIQYGAKIKLPASINVDAIRSDSRWCAPGPSHYNGSGGGRSLAEAQAAGWDAQTETCPLPPLARMLARVMQDRFIVATDQTYWGGPITFSVESYDRPRTGNWTGVPAGNPYGPYTGCDGIQGTGQWQPDTNTIGKPVAAGDWEQDCAQTPSAAWKGFPWDQMPWRGPEVPGEVPSLGLVVGQWIQDYCVVPDRELRGRPFILTEEQVRFLLWHYALTERASGAIRVAAS